MKITRIGNSNRQYFEEMLRGLPLDSGTVLGIMEDGMAVGCALVNSSPMSIEVSYIFIYPGFRRRGLGKAFVEEMRSLAVEKKKEALISYTASDKETLAFLEACGFKCEQNTELYSFKAQDFFESPRMLWILKRGVKRKSLHVKDLDNQLKNRLVRHCRRYSFDDILLDKVMYDEDISYVCVENNDISAVILAKRYGQKEVYITLLANFRKTLSGIMSVMAAFTAGLYKSEDYSDICFLDRSGDARLLVKKLLPPKSRITKKGSCNTAVLKTEQGVLKKNFKEKSVKEKTAVKKTVKEETAKEKAAAKKTVKEKTAKEKTAAKKAVKGKSDSKQTARKKTGGR